MPSMYTRKELQEKRKAAVAVVQELNELQKKENRCLTDEEQTKFDAAYKEQAELKRRIDVDYSAEKLEREFNRSQSRKNKRGTQVNGDPLDKTRSRDHRREQEITDDDRRHAINAWLCRQFGVRPKRRSERRAQEEACRKLRFTPRKGATNLPLFPTPQRNDFAREAGVRSQANGQNVQSRSMTTTVLATGGAMVPPVPPDLVFRLEQAMLAYDSVAPVAMVFRNVRGGDWPVPTADDTSNMGTLVGEGQSDGGTQDIGTGQKKIPVYKASSKRIKFSPELVEDSPFDVMTMVMDAMGERLGRAKSYYYTVGTGANQPAGLTVRSYLGKTAASATAIADTEVIDLIYSVDRAYRSAANPSYALMMSDLIVAYIMKLKDSQGRFQWQPSFQAGQPDRISGVPIVPNNYMATAPVSGAKTILAGDFSKFFVRESPSLRIRTFVELYGENDLDAMCGYLMFGSELIDAGTHPVKHLVH